MSFFKRETEYKLVWKAGDTEYLQVQYLKMDKITPMDFTGATMRMHLRKTLSSTNSTVALIGTADQTTGIITFTATPTNTRALATALKTRYIFDVEFANATRTKTLAKGTIQVETDVTR